MSTVATQELSWKDSVIRQDEIERYRRDGKDFIDDGLIEDLLVRGRNPDPARVRAIIAKAKAVETLDPGETAALLNVQDPGLWEEIFDAAAKVKSSVYDNRVVTFAPLYCANRCVNRCTYCGFRAENEAIQRRVLTFEEIEREARVLAGELGHKRIVAVYGEHPSTSADYIAESMRRIYSVKVNVRKGRGEIRRVNVNAAPMSIADLVKIQEAGIGTYQVFQETYHHRTYAEVHPAGTLKGNFDWRLYSLHRAMEAGIDDVAIGALFGLYDWRFEVMGMLFHARDLEDRFGIGPHTMSVPRIMKGSGNVISNHIKTIAGHKRENGDLNGCNIGGEPHYRAFFSISDVLIICLFQDSVAHSINPIRRFDHVRGNIFPAYIDHFIADLE
jgi:2-iminoacetate synthase